MKDSPIFFNHVRNIAKGILVVIWQVNNAPVKHVTPFYLCVWTMLISSTGGKKGGLHSVLPL